MKVALLLVGFGHVARRFVQLLEESRPALQERSIEPVVVGIVTQRHGGVFDEAGLDAIRAAEIRVEETLCHDESICDAQKREYQVICTKYPR